MLESNLYSMYSRLICLDVLCQLLCSFPHLNAADELMNGFKFISLYNIGEGGSLPLLMLNVFD